MSELDNKKSRVAEDLATLYLRLNGYFTTGFILHSPGHGEIHTEIDCIGVRFPHSKEKEREIGPDPFLQPSPSRIDVVLCEVKLREQKLQFNEALRREKERFERVLRWIGLFTEPQVRELAPQVMAALTPSNVTCSTAPEVIVGRKARIRGLVFSPERNSSRRRFNQPFFVGGDAMFEYISKCLCPAAPRPNCATVYDFTRWGHLEPAVRYFKQREADSPGTIKDLFDFVLEKALRQANS